MIDIHCHILPGLDDGPKDLFSCLEMANAAVDSGITDIFATPHHLNGQYENEKGRILECVDRINSYLLQENIPLTIHPGQELRIHWDLIKTIDRDEVLTFDNLGKFLLLELPSGEIPSYTLDVVYELLLKGITPIIAHPERNKGFIKEPEILFELVQLGALAQITAGSIIGHFGKKVKSFSKKIIEHQLVHFIASDSHHYMGLRGIYLHKAYNVINDLYGIEQTFYFRENVELLLKGQSVQKEQPIKLRKSIFAYFDKKDT